MVTWQVIEHVLKSVHGLILVRIVHWWVQCRRYLMFVNANWFVLVVGQIIHPSYVLGILTVVLTLPLLMSPIISVWIQWIALVLVIQSLAIVLLLVLLTLLFDISEMHPPRNAYWFAHKIRTISEITSLINAKQLALTVKSETSKILEDV